MPRAQPPPTAIRKPRVAVLLLAYATFTRRILDGVAAYAREHGPWQLQTGPHAGFEPIGDLAGWQGDAIIATLSSPQRAEEVLSLGIPTVNISSAVDDFGGPSVWVDNVGIGRTAAEHLLGQGYAHFAYAGEEERVFAASRLDGFNARLSEAGHTARSILAAPGALQDRDAWIAYRRRLADFVRELPKPCGLLACDDYHANIVMQACDQAGAHVPNEVGLIGVNDDDLICHLTDPPLSSIPLSGREIGRRAAELVDQMLRGEPIPPGRHTIPHQPVVMRGSTDALHYHHPAVRVALRRIRADAGSRALTVSELADEAAVSRRVLLEHFVREVGQTPSDAIAATRLAKLEQLLAQSDWSIKRIAYGMAFNSPADLNRFFRRHRNTTPTEFRVAARSSQ